MNFCVDQYHKSWKPWPKAAQVAIVRRTTAYGPTQQGRFTIRGPSSGGPFSTATIYGIIWMGDENWIITPGGPGQNLGLG